MLYLCVHVLLSRLQAVSAMLARQQPLQPRQVPRTHHHDDARRSRHLRVARDFFAQLPHPPRPLRVGRSDVEVVVRGQQLPPES